MEGIFLSLCRRLPANLLYIVMGAPLYRLGKRPAQKGGTAGFTYARMRGSVHTRCKGQFDGRWKEHTFAVSDSPTPTRPGQHTLCFEPSIIVIVETLGSCVDRVNIACTAMAAGLVIWVLGREIEGWTCLIERRRDGTRIEQPWRPMQTPLTTSGTRWGEVRVQKELVTTFTKLP